jgi:hypothetical protein
MYGQRCWVIPFRRKEKAKALTKDVDSFLRLCPCGLPQAGLNIQHVVVLGEEKGEHDAENIKKNVELNKIWNIWGKTHTYIL